MNSYTYHRQQGVALAISLILLVALTILGVATLTSTRFQEQITSNAQQKAVSFEAAESAINSVMADQVLIIDSIKKNVNGEYNDPDPVFPDGLGAILSTSLDQSNDKGLSLDISSSVSIQFCGERALHVGSELVGDISQSRRVAVVFDVNGIAEIANTNANSDHVLRSFIQRPETKRTGKCATPNP